ncbi:MAG: NAD-dependent epimerase/dehydratase family protein [Pedobacter sp.]
MTLKITLTGSTGFVGQNLTRYLENMKCDVLSISREQLNAGEFNSFKDSIAIVHLAGKAHDLKGSSDSEEYHHVNFELTKRIFDEFLASDVKMFIFLSSVKAAADSVDGILTEELLANPRTDYGRSKLMAEEYIQSQPLPVDKSYYILRPCMIHGPGNKGNLNLLYKFVKKNIPYPLAGFENKRSFLSIGNLCFVINELIGQEDIVSGVYNVSDSDALSTNEVVSILAESNGKQPKLWAIPRSIVMSIARIGDKLRLPLNTERLTKLTESYVVCNHKITSALGKSLPFSSREGLEFTANSFKKTC